MIKDDHVFTIQAHPEQLSSGYIPSLIIALIALIFWGYLFPIHEDSEKIKKLN